MILLASHRAFFVPLGNVSQKQITEINCGVPQDLQ